MNNHLKNDISGLDLSKGFYETYGKPKLEERFGSYMNQMTVGLAGEGSECFGFDDILSRDHDYGPSFCIWISGDLFKVIGKELDDLYHSLPLEYKGVAFNFRRRESDGRRGVIETRRFYQQFLGQNLFPNQMEEWLRLPENYLAVATNGIMFHCPDTEFARIRTHLLSFYPEDIRRKKLAANLIRMAHTGQVNYERMIRRKDVVASRLALAQFTEAAMRAVHLLNKKYAPYYKWMWRSLLCLPEDYGVGDLLEALNRNDIMQKEERIAEIEEICSRISMQLRLQEMSASDQTYLELQARSVMQSIEDERVRMLPIMMG